MPEAKPHRHARALVVAIAHVQPLTILPVTMELSPKARARRVRIAYRPALGQPPRRAHHAAQHVVEGFTACLPAKPGPYEGVSFIGERQLHGTAAEKNDDASRGCCTDLMYNAQHPLRQRHRRTIEALALELFGQADEYDRDVRAASRLNGSGKEHF